MNKDNIQKYIQSIINMPNEKAQAVVEKFELFELPKHQLLITENKQAKDTFILESGFVRSFTHDNLGNEVTTNLFSPVCFVNDFLAFFKQQPSSENFETLTPCVFWKMSYQHVQESFHNIPEFREFGRMMLVTNYSILQNRMLGMIKDTAETRYLKLMKQHPAVFQHVPLKIIASYLGVTDTSLSRIRKDISRK